MASQLPQPKTPEELAQVLGVLSGHATDNEQIKQATAILKAFLKKPNCVNPLMQQITSCPDAGIRQMAAVLLRRKILSHFRKLGAQVQATIKQSLLDRVVHEESRPVRLSVAALISTLASKLVPDNNWNELLQFLLQCSESQQAGHREVSMVLFRALSENVGQSLKPHFATLQQIFTRGLSDAEQNVRLEALRALGVLSDDLETEEEITRFAEVIPHMVEAVKRSVQEANEEAAAVAFEAFDNLAESLVPVLVPHLPIVVGLMAEVTANTTIDINIRDKASLFIASLCEGKPGKLVKLGLVTPLIDMCFKLAMEPYEDADVFESQEMTPQKIAVEIMDGLALNTPKQFVYDQCMQRIQGHLSDASNPVARKGALVILAVLAEGLAELLKPHLQTLLQGIVNSMSDPSSLVRSAAAVAITQFSDYLQPEVIDCHQMVMPALFKCLDSKTEDKAVKKRACTALDSFCEKLDNEIQPYIQPLMQHLVIMLKTSNDQQIQQGAISCIKSIAGSADEAFVPFFHETIQIMAELMTQKADEFLNLRAAATECMGSIALAVGKEKFAAFLPDAIKIAIEGTAMDHFQLREATYNFFQSLCRMLGPEFNQLMTTVMPLLLATCDSDDGVEIQGGDDGFGGAAPAGIDASDPDDDDEDDEIDGGRLRFMIRCGALDEKLAAVACIGTIASVVGEHFIPYLERTLKTLDELVCYPHHSVRAGVLETIQEIVGLLHQLYPNAEQWVAGKVVPLHQHVNTVINKVVPIFIDRMKDEDDKSVAAAACSALYDTCKKFGPAAVQTNIVEIYDAILELVSEKAPCQMAYDEDDPERADHDEVLIDDVTNVVGVLAMMVGPAFEEIFKQIFPALMKFTPANRPPSDRSMAIGCIAEVAESMGDRINPYLEQVFPLVMAGLADPSVHVRRNSAFCLRCLVGAAGQPMVQQFPQCLSALEPLLTVPADCPKYDREQIVCTKDNALSVLAAMIKSNAGALPMEKIVPVLLNGCPLTGDFEEAKHVYACIVHLFGTHTPLMMSNLPAAVNAIAGALHTKDMLEDQTVAQLVQLAKALPQQAGAQLEGVVNQLNPERKQAFMAAVQG